MYVKWRNFVKTYKQIYYNVVFPLCNPAHLTESIRTAKIIEKMKVLGEKHQIKKKTIIWGHSLHGTGSLFSENLPNGLKSDSDFEVFKIKFKTNLFTRCDNKM